MELLPLPDANHRGAFDAIYFETGRDTSRLSSGTDTGVSHDCPSHIGSETLVSPLLAGMLVRERSGGLDKGAPMKVPASTCRSLRCRQRKQIVTGVEKLNRKTGHRSTKTGRRSTAAPVNALAESIIVAIGRAVAAVDAKCTVDREMMPSVWRRRPAHQSCRPGERGCSHRQHPAAAPSVETAEEL